MTNACSDAFGRDRVNTLPFDVDCKYATCVEFSKVSC